MALPVGWVTLRIIWWRWLCSVLLSQCFCSFCFLGLLIRFWVPWNYSCCSLWRMQTVCWHSKFTNSLLLFVMTEWQSVILFFSSEQWDLSSLPSLLPPSLHVIFCRMIFQCLDGSTLCRKQKHQRIRRHYCN